MNRFLLPCAVAAVLAGVFLSPSSLLAQKVSADKKGHLYLTDAKGKRTQLTKQGKNSDPVLDPAKQRIAFVRATPGKTVETGSGEAEATELCIIDTEGKTGEVLVTGANHPKPEEVLGDFSTPCFSPDGGTLYFVSAAWATSGAVHAYDFATKQVRYICPGNDLSVVPGKGEYAGHLLMTQHRYFLGGGSYDWYWLCKPDGTEVGPVGEDTKMFREMYMKAEK